MVGLGAANSAQEVDLFRKRYQVPFPLLPDPELKAAGLLGPEILTPHFLVLALDGRGGGRVIYSQGGSLPELKKFLQRIKSQAGLN